MRFGVVFHGKWPFKIHLLWGFPWRFSDFTVCFTHLAIGGSLGVRTQVPVLVSSQNLISSLSWWHGSFSGHLGCFRRHWDSPNNFMACESWGMMTQIHPEKSNQRSIVVDIWSTRKLNMHWWMTKWPGFAAHRSHLLLKFSFEFAHLQVVFTWNTCGTLVEHLWNTCGTLVEHLWNTCGTLGYLDIPLKVTGIEAVQWRHVCYWYSFGDIIWRSLNHPIHGSFTETSQNCNRLAG